jgi:hypothetical protein
MLPIAEHTTDTHGYTEMIFGAYDLLGLRFAPRIRDLDRQQLYRHEPTSAVETAELLKHKLRLELITPYWDELRGRGDPESPRSTDREGAMTTATSHSSTAETRIAISTIQRPGNVRDLNAEHVASLAQSINLRGLLVPVIVRPVEGGYQLVAGHHRLAACESLGHTEIDVVIRDREGSRVERVGCQRAREDALDRRAGFDGGGTLSRAARARRPQRAAARPGDRCSHRVCGRCSRGRCHRWTVRPPTPCMPQS